MQCNICDCGEGDGVTIHYLVSDDANSDDLWAYSIDNMFIRPICAVCLIYSVEYHPDVPYHHILFGQPLQPIF